MGNVVWLIIALAVGTALGTLLRPGIPEIVIVAFAVTALAYCYRNMSLRNRHRVAKDF